MPRSSIEGESLCCCEYYNTKGEKSHILACCCDCEAVDTAFDRFLTCQSLQAENIKAIADIVQDRCRVPGVGGGGAVKLQLDVIIPIVTIPSCICISALHPFLTMIIIPLMPLFMLLFYKLWRRQSTKERTKFFYIWGLTSVFLMLILFDGMLMLDNVIDIHVTDIVLLHIMSSVMFYMLYLARQDPGTIHSGDFEVKIDCHNNKKEHTFNNEYNQHVPYNNSKDNCVQHTQDSSDCDKRLDPSLASNPMAVILVNNFGIKQDDLLDHIHQAQHAIYKEDLTWADSRPIIDNKLSVYCDKCNVQRKPRSGHCSVCNACIRMRDHHCVWIDNCIGVHNHRSFILAMILFIFTSIYGGSVVIVTTCQPESYWSIPWLPVHCSWVYNQYRIALCFVGAVYAFLAGILMCVTLFSQTVTISQDLTSQELHCATQRGTAQIFCVKNNVNNEGLLNNWVKFWTGTRKESYET